MTTSGPGPVLVLVLAVGVLVGCGVILLLERSLTRILLGVILLGNGVNLLILLGGRSGEAPIVGTGPVDRMSDPLPQAMVLTAIVITFGLTAFLLAVAYRSWYLTGDDEVPDDLEDRQIVRRAERDEVGTVDLGGEGPDDDPEQVDPEPARRRLRRGDEV
ncbi:Na(+)/H(+) antiporter subunit C [Micromonospora sp. U21]|uniref:Na(+)/H(+) antiporter subunit C n=1 Tax=Micromonospora sp. U21 TaxID=2824899 RepID=UPI001B387C5C|nr:Na(+)/H(+) antiporter subunit C [Micromonospora sp. U21]MBQ0900824.1 Na(+)/H(+) antiporter subunit C [Micromonospora sp. U21]